MGPQRLLLQRTQPERSQSFTKPPPKPPFPPPKQGCLKVLTHDESLHTPYGSKRTKHNASKELKFDTIEIREYARTVGDNPSCSSGPPLTIEWTYDPDVLVVPVDAFEEVRPPRRPQFQLMLGREERQEILMDEWEIPQHEIVRSVRSMIKVKNQRRRTLNNIGTVSHMEEKMENVTRKLKKSLLLRKDKSKELLEASLQASEEEEES